MHVRMHDTEMMSTVEYYGEYVNLGSNRLDSGIVTVAEENED